MINIIKRRASFSDDILCLCWTICCQNDKIDKNPLKSELWKTISLQCQDIIKNDNKLDWYWFKKCLLPSKV